MIRQHRIQSIHILVRRTFMPEAVTADDALGGVAREDARHARPSPEAIPTRVIGPVRRSDYVRPMRS